MLTGFRRSSGLSFGTLLALSLSFVIACAPSPAPVATPVPKPAMVATPEQPAKPTSVPTVQTAATVQTSAATQAPAAVAKPTQKDKVTLRLDWVPTPSHVGSTLAQERGYYDKEGIDIEISEGKGSAIAVQVVAAGQATFGIADATTMALAVGKGVPVKMIANMTQLGPIGVIYLPPLKIEKPEDLQGKSVSAAPGDASYTALPAVMKKAGLNTDVYKVVQMDAATKIPALLEKKVDTIV